MQFDDSRNLSAKFKQSLGGVKFSLRAADLKNEEKGKLRSAAVMDGVGGSFF